MTHEASPWSSVVGGAGLGGGPLRVKVTGSFATGVAPVHHVRERARDRSGRGEVARHRVDGEGGGRGRGHGRRGCHLDLVVDREPEERARLRSSSGGPRPRRYRSARCSPNSSRRSRRRCRRDQARWRRESPDSRASMAQAHGWITLPFGSRRKSAFESATRTSPSGGSGARRPERAGLSMGGTVGND